MKSIITIIFIIFLSFTAQAQSATTEIKVETVEMTIAPKTNYELNRKTTTQVARLYKFKNAKIKKELNFITKADKPKMA